MADVEIPQLEETGMLSGDDAGRISEVEQSEAEKDDAAKTTNGTKENVPPKRPASGTALKRTSTSSTSTTKSSVPSSRATGGLSKPPTRPTAGSVARKTPSSATVPTSSSGHRSSASTGGSSDEKKKPLAAAARKSSLASAGAHQSVRSESLSEKRGTLAPSTSTIVRKPAGTTSSSNPKVATKPTSASVATKTSTTTGSTSSRLVPTSKPLGNGAVIDAKKRLSSIAGSPAVGRSTRTPTSTTTSTKEVDELRAKLANAEGLVEALKKEVSLSQTRLIDLGKAVDEEGKRVEQAEETIRTQHTDLIEKLQASHKSDVEEFQAQLADASASHKTAHELSLKAIEDATAAASATAALEAAISLEELKTEHASVVEAINLQVSKAHEASDAAAASLVAKDVEIAELKSQIEEETAKTVALKAEYEINSAARAGEATSAHQTALSNLQKTLAKEHESTLATLKAAHTADIAKGSTETTSAYDRQVADLTQKHESSISELQTQLEEAVDAKAKLEAEHKQTVESLQTKSAATITKLTGDIASLNSKLEAVQKELLASQEELSELLRDHEAVQITSAENEMTLAATKNELADAKQELSSLREVIDTLEVDGKNKDQAYDKIKTELSSTISKHEKELRTVSDDYEKEIAALQGNSGIKNDYEELKAKHEQLTTAHNEAVNSHTEELDSLKTAQNAVVAALDNSTKAHSSALEELKATHAKNLDEAHDRAITAGHMAHAAELEQLQASHAEKLKASESALQAEGLKGKELLMKANQQLETLKETLAMEQLARASAQADLDAAASKKSDTTETDALRLELARITKEASQKVDAAQFKALEEELTRLTKEASQKVDSSQLEALRSELARVTGEASKRIDPAEVDILRNDLHALKEVHQVTLVATQQESAKATEQYLKSQSSLKETLAELNQQKLVAGKRIDPTEVETIRKDLQSLKDQHQAALMTAQQESAKATEEHLETKGALEKTLAEFDKHKLEAVNVHKTAESDYKDLNDSMTQLIEDANARASDVEARLREAEAQLKLKHAELIEANTKTLKGLKDSIYAESVATAEGEHNSSSSALALLAKASVTAQQLEQMNEDLRSEHLRSLESISDTSPPPKP